MLGGGGRAGAGQGAWHQAGLPAGPARDSSYQGGPCPLSHLLRHSEVLRPGQEAGKELGLVVAPFPHDTARVTSDPRVNAESRGSPVADGGH